MRRDQLEHAIRTACQIIGRPEVIVVGSQSILGTFREDELPVPPPCRARSISSRSPTATKRSRGSPTSSKGLRGSSRRSKSSTASASMASTWRHPRCRRDGGIDWSRCKTPTRPRLSWRATVHRLVPRQGGSLRCEVVRVPREGPELRLRAAQGRPRRFGRDFSPSSDGSRAIPPERGARRRMARVLSISLDAPNGTPPSIAGHHRPTAGGNL